MKKNQSKTQNKLTNCQRIQESQQLEFSLTSFKEDRKQSQYITLVEVTQQCCTCNLLSRVFPQKPRKFILKSQDNPDLQPLFNKISLNKKIKQLRKQNKQKSANYAQFFQDILYFTVVGYKVLNLEIVAQGNKIEQGPVGGKMRIFSTVLGLAQKSPVVGSACSVVNEIIKYYCNISQKVIIQKVAYFFSNLMWKSNINQAVLFLISNQYYIDFIQNSCEKNKGWLQICKDLSEEVVKKLEGIQFQKKLEFSYALFDCSFLIKQIICLQGFENNMDNKNLLLDLVINLIKERKKPSQAKKKSKRQEKVDRCCDCQII